MDTGGPLEDMAARCLAAVRTFQPEGPYQLVGLCFGGKVLYEMACQLVDQGHEVRFLLLINCFNEEALIRGAAVDRSTKLRRRLLMHARYHLSALARQTPIEMLSYLGGRAQAVLDDDILPGSYNLFARIGAIPRFLARQELRHRYLARQWKPRPFSGTSMLIWNSVPRRNLYPSPQMGWEGLLPENTEGLAVPDNGIRFWVEPNIRFVATQLTRLVERPRTVDAYQYINTANPAR
jgi:thioesterase domain-containing protein